MRWTWLQTCINIVIAAFSLRELVRVRFWFTRWSTPRGRWRGGSLPPVVDWETQLQYAKSLPTFIGFSWCLLYGSVSDIAARGDSCAARWNALSATHGALLGMTLVGMALLCICCALFPYWHDQLDAMGGSVVAATPAGQRMIAARTNMLGLLSMLGKNLLHPVLPCTVVCDALYVYRCLDSRWGLFYVISSILFSALLYSIRIWDDLTTWRIVSRLDA